MTRTEGPPERQLLRRVSNSHQAPQGGQEATAPALETLARQWAVLLTTFKRDGTPVGTAVSVAVEDDRAFVRTWDKAWKLRRIRNIPVVEVAPSTARGKPTGPAIRARVLEGEKSASAGRLLVRKHPILHGLLVPLVHRLRGNRTMHVELTPISGQNPGAVDGATPWGF